MSFAAPIGMFIAGPVSSLIVISSWMICAGVLMLVVGVLSYLITRKYDEITLDEVVLSE
jgi:DHA3 family macrolide efflux protein-like MFS transporter